MTPEKNKEHFTVETMSQFKHIFLTRHPKLTLESYYRTISSKHEGGYFSAEEAGFKELHETYTWIKQNVDSSPLVIDGEDLVRDEETTEKLFEHICTHVGMPFDKTTLQWEKKTDYVSMNFDNPAFHEALVNSTGIQKIEHEEQEFPQYVKDAIE